MLSAETSAGRYPVEAARMMSRIACEAEESLRWSLLTGFKPSTSAEPPAQAEIIAGAACRIANVANAAAIVVFTATGASARLIARYRPPVPVYAFTSNAAAARQLSVIFGLRAVVREEHASTDEMMELMNRTLVEDKLVRPGDAVVFVAGQPIGIPGTTNMVKLHRIG